MAALPGSSLGRCCFDEWVGLGFSFSDTSLLRPLPPLFSSLLVWSAVDREWPPAINVDQPKLLPLLRSDRVQSKRPGGGVRLAGRVMFAIVYRQKGGRKEGCCVLCSGWGEEKKDGWKWGNKLWDYLATNSWAVAKINSSTIWSLYFVVFPFRANQITLSHSLFVNSRFRWSLILQIKIKIVLLQSQNNHCNCTNQAANLSLWFWMFSVMQLFWFKNYIDSVQNPFKYSRYQ